MLRRDEEKYEEFLKKYEGKYQLINLCVLLDLNRSQTAKLMERYETLKDVFFAPEKALRDIMKLSQIKRMRLIPKITAEAIREDLVYNRAPVHSPEIAAGLFAKYIGSYTFGESHEHLFVMYLNIKNKVLDIEMITQGEADNATIPMRRIFRRAVELSSSSIILGHNHPSGSPELSHQDYSLYQKAVKNGELIGISVLDLLAIGGNQYASARAGGRIEKIPETVNLKDFGVPKEMFDYSKCEPYDPLEDISLTNSLSSRSR